MIEKVDLCDNVQVARPIATLHFSETIADINYWYCKMIFVN